MEPESRRGAGGTPGGLGEFFGGVILAGLGIYLLLSRVDVHTAYWSFNGMQHAFGVSLLPLIFGLVALFVSGRSILGWVLTVGGLLFIVAGVLLNMDITFQSTSLPIVLIIVATMAAGFGLIFRSLRPH
jgi:hypothetical protein